MRYRIWTLHAAWCRAATATALFAASAAAANPLISELFYDAVGSDNGHSFVELAGEPGTPLDGLFVEGINGAGGGVTVSIALTGVIAEDGLFLLADVDADGLTSVAEADQLANFDFQNGPDSSVLRSNDAVLDAVGYGSFGDGDVFAGEGEPAPDAPAGSSLARLFADRDSDDNAADFLVEAEPTPGQAVFLPEPGSDWGMLAALVTVGWLRRRRAHPNRCIRSSARWSPTPR
jgi:hypothetical protein